MPVKTLTTTKSYLKLLTELKSILIQGLKAIEEERVKTYWQTGKIISKYLLANQERAGYGDNLFVRLSEDLKIAQRTLEQSVKFYRTFPIPHVRTELGWTHYRALITVKDKQKRLIFQKQAIKHNWSAEDLQKAIRIYKLQFEDLTEESSAAPQKLRFCRGHLYTYRLIKADYIDPLKSDLLLDLGFSFWRDISLKGIANPQEGQIVESVKLEQGYKLKPTDTTRKQLYTYKALIERVTDADTLWVHIDLGFYNWSRQKIRFRGIDAPEVSTQKGQKAKEFVEARLTEVPFVIIKTYSPDKYGRYLSDVFYLAGETSPQKVLQQGVFLNQELLDLGLAKISNQ
jgi:endonuclease YncB( thermonuclease family)